MTKIFSKGLAGPCAAGVLLCVSCLNVCAAQAANPPQAANPAPSAMSTIAADHISLSVGDLEKMSDWYVKVLGFKVVSESKRPTGMVNRQLRNANYRIDLITFPGSARPPRPDPVYLQQGYVHLALSVTDIMGAYNELKAAGATLKPLADPTKPPAAIVFQDPEGNEIEIFPRSK